MDSELPDLSDSEPTWPHRLIGVVLYLFAILCSWRLLHLYEHDVGLDHVMLPALGAIAAPLLALGMVATAPHAYSIGPVEDGSFQFRVGWVVLIPGYALQATLLGQFELVAWWALILVALVGGFIFACVISRSEFKLVNFVGIMAFSSAYVGGAVLFINCMFDYKPVEVVAQRQADVRVGPRHFTVRFKHARPDGYASMQLNDVKVSDVSNGICVRYYRGGLFLNWYTVDPYMDCPGTDPVLDDVTFQQKQLCAAGRQDACQAVVRLKAGKTTPAELAANTAESACAKGDRRQCQQLCDSGKPHLRCGNQEWRIMGRGWTVEYWTEGASPDGRYSAHVGISCTSPLAANTQPASKPVRHLIEYNGEQFRGPVSKGMHKTMADAVKEVCTIVPAPAQPPKKPIDTQPRSNGDEGAPEARGTSAATSVHKCKDANGKVTFTDMPCPKGGE
jgi:hypothetical protein